MSQLDEYENEGRHAKGGVEIEDSDGDDPLRRVTLYCEACGEEMDELYVLKDRAEELREEDPQPVHESAECIEAAKDALGGTA